MQSKSGLEISRNLTIPQEELEFTFVRSSGPGGQNVNKVNSKAQLKWNVQTSQVLSPYMRQRICAFVGNRINRKGELTLTSDASRDQQHNMQICLDKLQIMIQSALHVAKTRRPTKPSRSAIEKRLNSKAKRGERKRQRGKVSLD